MSDEIGKKLCDRMQKIKGTQDQFNPLWNDCADFCLLFSERGIDQPDRTNISPKLFDETAVLAGEFFDCALHGMLTNPAGTFFKWETEDPDLMEYDEVKNFLQQATKRAHHIIANTNYHTAKARQYTHIRTYGTAPFYAEEDPERGIIFTAGYIGSVYIAENSKGIIDTHFRPFNYTARQAAQKWGEDALPQSIKEYINKDGKEGQKKFKFLHATFPREDRDFDSKKSTDLPFASFYVNIDEQVLIREGGYFENPWATPRWKRPWRSPIGTSPAMNVLASIKMLNEMEQTNLIAGHKTIEPPLQLPLEMQGKKFKDYAGGLNFYDSNKGKILPIHTIDSMAFALDMAERRRKTIDEGFFKHVLQLPMKSNMTIPEILERLEEQIRVLGPMVGRLFFEGLNVELDRIFGVLLRGRYLGRPPEILEGQEIKVQYLSSIARAQRIAEIKAALQANEIMGPYLQIFSDLKDNLNGDDMFRDVTTGMGMPHNWLRSIDDRDALRALRQQMEQEQAAITQLAQGADVAGKIKEVMA